MSSLDFQWGRRNFARVASALAPLALCLCAAFSLGQSAFAAGTTNGKALDCAHSGQQALCTFVSQVATSHTPATVLSTACSNPTNVVNADSSNLVSVLKNATSGQTIVVAPGTYNVAGNTFPIVSGVNYCGNGAVLQERGFIFKSYAGNNITFDNFVLDGGTLYMTDNFTQVYVQNSTFENAPNLNTGDENSGTGVAVGNASNVVISHNYFYNDNSGLKVWSNSGPVTISDNSFSHMAFDDFASQGNTGVPHTSFYIYRNGFEIGRAH